MTESSVNPPNPPFFKGGIKGGLKLWIGSIIGFLLAAVSLACMSRAGRFLVKEDPLVTADAALVFSGDPEFERTREASRLYREGWFKKLIMTGHGYSGDDSRAMKAVAVQEGVRPRDIYLEKRSASTYTNILFSRDIVRAQGFTTVALVSSPYHMRRISALVTRIYGNDGLLFICHPVRKSVWSPDGWWKTGAGRGPVIREYMKLLAYWVFGVLDRHNGGILWTH